MAELLELNKVDVVCLQETKRQNFTDKELSDFAVCLKFVQMVLYQQIPLWVLQVDC